MLQEGIKCVNEILQEIESEWRLSKDVTNEELFDLYMAKKKSGKPKDDYPSKYLEYYCVL